MKFRIDGTDYDMIQMNVTFAEARAIEKVTGKAFAALANEQAEQSIDVVQAMLWVSMKRVDPTLVFSDLDDIDVTSIEYIEEEAEADTVVEEPPVPLEPSEVVPEQTTSPSLV